MRTEFYRTIASIYVMLHNFLTDKCYQTDAVIRWAIAKGGLEEEFSRVSKEIHDENHGR